MDKADKVMNLAVRRGFFWPAYEIYGGVAGMYVWGPLGVVLKNKIIGLWRAMFIEAHDFLEIESPSIAPHIVFKASGHVESFKDIMVSCSGCGRKFRADTLLAEKGIEISEAVSLDEVDSIIKKNKVKCPICGGIFEHPSYFTTMFKTTIGPYSDSVGFLRPETAQGMFVEFKRIYESFRRRLPVGIAQIGRGFRNEISPRQGPIRLREFDMMELEYFFDPKSPDCPYLDEVMDEELNLLHERLIKEGGKEYDTMTVREAVEQGVIKNGCMAYFMVLATRFMELLGIPRENQRFKEKLEGERAHYAVQTFDQEVRLARWGWVEVSGHANRTDYDLSSHIKNSGKDLYAYRQLDEPREVEVIEVTPLPRKIREGFGGKIKDIMRGLSSIDQDSLKKSLVERGYVEVAGVKLGKEYFDIDKYVKQVTVEPFIPHVVEPSFGLDRIAYSVLEYAYKEVNDRVVLSLPPYLAPYDVSVYPLLEDEGLLEIALNIRDTLSSEGYRVLFDTKESIGRRYARADEIGVPVAVTIDHQSLKDDTVTVRDRDTWKQYRIKREGISRFLDLVIQGHAFDTVAREMGLESFSSKE